MSARVEPSARHFRVSNWFAWMVEAHAAGYSRRDIRWILQTLGVWDRIVEIVEAEQKGAQP